MKVISKLNNAILNGFDKIKAIEKEEKHMADFLESFELYRLEDGTYLAFCPGQPAKMGSPITGFCFIADVSGGLGIIKKHVVALSKETLKSPFCDFVIEHEKGHIKRGHIDGNQIPRWSVKGQVSELEADYEASLVVGKDKACQALLYLAREYKNPFTKAELCWRYVALKYKLLTCLKKEE